MSGAVIRQNEEVTQRSKANVIKYYEQIEGKRDLLKTVMQLHPEDVDYIRELKRKIRRAEILLSHIKA